MKSFTHFALILGLLFSAAAQAGEKKAAPVDAQKKIDFDDKLVEGMNLKDLSSAEHTGEARRRSTDRLIREKTDFRDEVKRSLKEVRWAR
jgi:hypothetical protein